MRKSSQVGPPDAAPRDPASPQVHALHAGRETKISNLGRGRGSTRISLGSSLKEEVRSARPPAFSGSSSCAPSPGDVQEVPEDAVLVQAHDLLERLFYLPLNRSVSARRA